LEEKLDEGFIFYHVLHFLKKHGWRVIGGEPPDGTSDEVQRIVIRNSNKPKNLVNKYTQKVDLMAIKSQTLLLIELKPSFDISDKKKLDFLNENQKDDISNAIEERTEIKRENITHRIKCLGFSNISSYPELDDFIVFLIDKKGSVEIKKGKNISRVTFD